MWCSVGVDEEEGGREKSGGEETLYRGEVEVKY
jgi:hypothetical protein